MLAYEEYLAPARPREVLAAMKEAAISLGWGLQEEHPDSFFSLETGTSARLEPRKLRVSVEERGMETLMRVFVWCSGFSVRRYDGKVDLVKALPFKCTRLSNKSGTGTSPGDPQAADGARRPPWVTGVRCAEFGLLALSIVAVVLFAVAIARDWPRWSAVAGLAIGALASVGSGLILDLAARRVLKVASKAGFQNQLRRAGISAAIAVVLLIWLWRM